MYVTLAIYLVQKLLFCYHIKGRPMKLLELFFFLNFGSKFELYCKNYLIGWLSVAMPTV